MPKKKLKKAQLLLIETIALLSEVELSELLLGIHSSGVGSVEPLDEVKNSTKLVLIKGGKYHRDPSD